MWRGSKPVMNAGVLETSLKLRNHTRFYIRYSIVSISGVMPQTYFYIALCAFGIAMVLWVLSS
jgi:hypothetical protein